MLPALTTSSQAAPEESARASLAATSLYAATNVVSSKGKRLRLSVSAYKYAGRTTRMSVTIGNRTGSETHEFAFPRATLDLASSGAGIARLTGTQSGGRGLIKLRVTTDGAMKTTRCGGEVASKRRNMVVKGIAFFDTASAWGKVGSRTRTTRFTSAHTVRWSYNVDCPPGSGEIPRCQTGLNWRGSVSSGSVQSSISGFTSGTTARVSGARWVELAKPNGATRVDTITRTGVTAPTLAESGGTATMEVYGPRGSATLVSSYGAGTFSYQCKQDTGTATQSSTGWTGSLTNGSVPLQVSAAIFGAIKVPDSADGAHFGRVTVSAD